MKSQDYRVNAEELFNNISQDNEVLRLFKFHSLRVMYLSINLSKMVNCYDEDMRIASLLHDIGKIGLSKDILLKPSRLDAIEYQIVQAHSVIGNNILRRTLDLPRAAIFVRDHHERWDGTGYPRGLKGEEISIQGRIIGICDAFDTMTIDRRNYNRRTLTYDEALNELKACSWSQFDGDLVEKFVWLISDLNLPPSVHWAEDETRINNFIGTN
ncbi:HD-GYP domain-containing protein [Evansella tamaricis]|uniref:HD domain-containing protein n=1 Tax=Evansella tamaricis TaxID=2069301 RepID=A0ABS6JI42_9BACI|nr:HD domain-containing phosphohydrolase [Evansella tamaricis]MBU9713342.1 HD domain-containing protein [Evansella tamaricis]